MKPKKKGVERHLINWLKEHYRTQKHVVLAGAIEIRELLLPVAGLHRSQLSPGMAARIDRLARHELAREPNPPAITIPVPGSRHERRNDAPPELRHATVTQRTRGLVTQIDNLAAIGSSHAAQANATEAERLTADRLRMLNALAQAAAKP